MLEDSVESFFSHHLLLLLLRLLFFFYELNCSLLVGRSVVWFNGRLSHEVVPAWYQKTDICVYECAWYYNTFLVQLPLGNKVVLYCIVLYCIDGSATVPV